MGLNKGRRWKIRIGTAALSFKHSRFRQTRYQLRWWQYFGKGYGDRSADRQSSRGAVGKGLWRRHRLDGARRFLNALHGQAERAERTLSRGRIRRRDGRLPAPLHLQTESKGRIYRHAPARLCTEKACRPRARRCDHCDCRLGEFERIDTTNFWRPDRLAAMEASGV